MPTLSFVFFFCLLSQFEMRVFSEKCVGNLALKPQSTENCLAEIQIRSKRHSNGTYADDNPDSSHNPDSNNSTDSDQKPIDCSELRQMGKHQSGVYTIYPKISKHNHSEITVYCDMDTDDGGWTVIQRRGNNPEETNFFRTWEEYKNGFGSVAKDFWLGNENIHALSNQGAYSLRIDLTRSDGRTKYALYKNFWISDEFSQYVLHASYVSGTLTNGLLLNNNKMFSTYDRPNLKKASVPLCADTHRGAWWYPAVNCGFANLNGEYTNGTKNIQSNWWFLWEGYKGMKKSEMKIRPMMYSSNNDMEGR